MSIPTDCPADSRDRKSTRLNSSHQIISYAVFCLKKKKSNINDIDDRIIVRAADNKEPIDALTARTGDASQSDMRRLGALAPDHEPRATQYVAEMVTLIQKLVDKGHAYAAEGHVLFSVPSMTDYGRLSRRTRDELVAGARVEVAPYKKDPADFVLWKPSTDTQPGC